MRMGYMWVVIGNTVVVNARLLPPQHGSGGHCWKDNTDQQLVVRTQKQLKFYNVTIHDIIDTEFV